MLRSERSRVATSQDFEFLLETMTLAFSDDPVWGDWAFPDRQRALELRRAFFRLWLESSLRYNWLRVTQGCEAVAAWFPPGEAESTPEDERRLISTAKELLGDRAAVFMEGCDLIEASHPRTRPHYYLSLIGTHPKHRGRGIGMALLSENLARIDAEGMPAYLESTNPGNNSRYERLGFTKFGRFTLPGGGPSVDTMWREPHRMRVRQATGADHDIVTALVLRLLSELFDPVGCGYSRQTLAPAVEKLIRDGSRSWALLACLDQDPPIGILTLNECTAIYAFGHFGEISELYVEPEYRSAGVGAALVDEAIRFGRERGWSLLEVGAPDVPRWQRTVDFYLRCGFSMVGPRLTRDLDA